MADDYINSVMKISVSALCGAVGWNSAQSSTIDILADIFRRQFLQIAKRSHRYAEHSGRTQVNFEDAELAFKDLGIQVSELEEYIQNFTPVLFPHPVPLFPIKKDSSLNFLRPGSEEVLTRPVHVHEYMPPMNFSEEEQQGSPFKENKENEEKDSEKTFENLEIEEESPGTPPSSTNSTSLTPKSGKRLESGENAALKRARLTLEEEGHRSKEMTSVIMTTSGFLTSSREGRLPESRPPTNRDFFEPLAVIPVEKKKKNVTMKRIIEGVKKIEKENQNETAEASLFATPDLILPGPSEKKKMKLKEKAERAKIIKFKKKLHQTLPQEKKPKEEKGEKQIGEKREAPFLIPIPKISPSVKERMIEAEKQNKLSGSQKKKRGRPKKVPGQIPFRPKEGSFKMVKVRKPPEIPYDEEDMQKFVPEISINVKPVAPPDFSLLSRLPSTPGLIPASFASGSMNKLQNHLPPSISITASPQFQNPNKDRSGASFAALAANVCPSVTITRIEMQKKAPPPAPYNPHIPEVKLTTEPTSGITITPIVMDKTEKPPTAEEEKSREERKKEKEKRKELRKEKKKEKKEKSRIKDKSEKGEKSEKKEKKDKEKKKKREKDLSEVTVPKLTFKFGSASTTPLDSPNPHTEEPPPPRKITIKPIEEKEIVKKRSPTPELARIAPLVTRPPKISPNLVPIPKKSPNIPIPPGEIVDESYNSKRGPGRPPKGPRGPGRPPKPTQTQTAGLVTETVGFYIDHQGNKIWICPACGRQDDGSPMIGCDTCDDWYHFTCVGIVDTPDETESWFCKRCRTIPRKKSKEGEPKKKFPKL